VPKKKQDHSVPLVGTWRLLIKAENAPLTPENGTMIRWSDELIKPPLHDVLENKSG